MSSCGCGSSCQCGSSCGGGCRMYPDVEKSTATAITIDGVAPPVKTYLEESEKSTGTEAGHACKCGSNCTCDPCNC